MPKAWLRVIEEQSRLTLHAHFLIWIYGHCDLQSQLQQAIDLDEIEVDSSSFLANSSVSLSSYDGKLHKVNHHEYFTDPSM